MVVKTASLLTGLEFDSFLKQFRTKMPLEEVLLLTSLGEGKAKLARV